MGKKYAAFLLLITLSCGRSEDRPDDVLSQDDMVKVLAEVYITEAKISHLGLAPDSATAVFGRVQGRVFETTGVPDSVFKKSLNYYLTQPKELEQIYAVLIDTLQLREQRVSGQ